MKRLIIALTLMVSSGYMLAQSNAQQDLPTGEATALYADYMEPGSAMATYFDAMRDASFPTEETYADYMAELSSNPKQTAAGILNILLGGIGVGHFYTGQTLRGVLDILFCWTGVPGIIGLVEGIIWLCDTDEEWAARVAKWNS